MKYTFETILVYLKQGKKVRRSFWGEGVYVYILGDDFMFHYPKGYLIPLETAYTICHADILAEDWEVCNEME